MSDYQKPLKKWQYSYFKAHGGNIEQCAEDFFNPHPIKGLEVTNLNLLRQLYVAWEVLMISNEYQKLSN